MQYHQRMHVSQAAEFELLRVASANTQHHFGVKTKNPNANGMRTTFIQALRSLRVEFRKQIQTLPAIRNA